MLRRLVTGRIGTATRRMSSASSSGPADQYMTAGEAVTETLADRGIKDVFAITGSAFLPASDCFEAAGIRLIHMQHEQNGGFACDGYARALAGAVGVTLNQAGPGASNLLTAMATSFWNHSPVAYITPTVDTPNDGKGVFQELRGQDRLFSDQVKYLGHVNREDRLTEILGKGLDRALSEGGPTQVNIPRDFFNAESTYSVPGRVVPSPCAANTEDIHRIVKLYRNAERPVILAGAGVGWSDTGAENLLQLARALNVPVATTYLHNDVFPSHEELSLGPLGYFGSHAAMRAVRDSDLVLAIGTRIGPFSITPQDGINYWDDTKNLVQVDLNRSNLGISCNPTVAVHSDAGNFCQQLLSALQSTSDIRDSTYVKSEKDRWEEELLEMEELTTIPEDGAMAPWRGLRVLGDHVYNTDSVLTTDIGNVSSQMNRYAHFSRSRSYLAPGLYGSCGYSVPAALGAKVACPDRNVIALVGDGAFMMNPVCELPTLVREKIPLTIVIARNDRWWAEGLNLHLHFGKRYGGTILESPSFAEVARSLGDIHGTESIQGIEVRTPTELSAALDTAKVRQAEGGTTVIEAHMTPEVTRIFREGAVKTPVRRLPKYQHLNEKNNDWTNRAPPAWTQLDKTA